MIQKNFNTEIFLKMIQNGPIRKVFTIKVIFDYFFIFCPAVGHHGSTLRKFLEDFFKKSQVRNSHYLFLKLFMDSVDCVAKTTRTDDLSSAKSLITRNFIIVVVSLWNTEVLRERVNYLTSAFCIFHLQMAFFSKLFLYFQGIPHTELLFRP